MVEVLLTGANATVGNAGSIGGNIHTSSSRVRSSMLHCTRLHEVCGLVRAAWLKEGVSDRSGEEDEKNIKIKNALE